MKHTKTISLIAFLIYSFLILYVAHSSAHQWSKKNIQIETSNLNTFKIPRPLLASRFNSLEELSQTVHIQYSDSLSSSTKKQAQITYSDQNTLLRNTLVDGLSQDDITKAKNGSIVDKISLTIKEPYAVRNRGQLGQVLTLARRKYSLGPNDVAFFDLALALESNITNPYQAFIVSKDSSEKGYLNTFNHITAQAFITAIYSNDLADYIGDLHELKNMKELVTGRFSSEQLIDSLNNPIDNYIDLINNTIGQELGNYLKIKYNIRSSTKWSPELLSIILNDLQDYYSWSLKLRLRPFKATDDTIVRFSKKLNTVVRDQMKTR
ncbi:MAG: hypothetical protein ACPGTP_06655 [Bacteroidia bacterium]